MKKISDLSNSELAVYIQQRRATTDSLWDIVQRTYDTNLAAYKNNPAWLKSLAEKRSKVRDNRIFVNTEAVINALIANPPKPNVVQGRDTPESRKLAYVQEKYFIKKYNDRNVKEVLRKALRNLYFSRLAAIKVYWNTKIDDFDLYAVDPRKVRFSKNSTKEEDSDIAIEEIETTVQKLIETYPEKKDEILTYCGGQDMDITNISTADVCYWEAWVEDHLVCLLGDVILSNVKNPYWDWDGIPVSAEEMSGIYSGAVDKKKTLEDAKIRQFIAKKQGVKLNPEYEERAYMYNYFSHPRKPYIFATAFNNENTPIGQTDIITQAIPLQEDIDETKRNITENARIVNGIVKVESSSMSLADANKLRWQTGGIIYGKGVSTAVTRETGSPLPAFVQQNLDDSRKEIDDIMAASSAFRGIREGQETRGGRIALIDQSFLRLNELVQVVDYLNFEMFNWFFQLAKLNYTKKHIAKLVGQDRAVEVLELTQDDFEDGIEVRIIPGKTLPEDRQFKYEQAQKDFQSGVIGPIDYLEAAGYDEPAAKAKAAVAFKLNPAMAVGITSEELQALQPPSMPEEKPPTLAIKYEDLPADAKIQALAKLGIKTNPELVIAEELHKRRNGNTERRPNREE